MYYDLSQSEGQGWIAQSHLTEGCATCFKRYPRTLMYGVRGIVLCQKCHTFILVYTGRGWTEISIFQPPPGDFGNFVLARFSDLYEEQAALEA